MYWTDKNGLRIPGSKIMLVTGHIGTGGIVFSNGTPDYVVVRNIRWALPTDRFALADLTLHNAALVSALAPFPGPESFTLAPGEVRVLPYATTVSPGSPVVAVYATSGAGTAASTLVFVQEAAQ
jgi:hypothetical protein